MRRPLQVLWLFLSLGRIDCVGVLHRCVLPRCRPFDVMRWRVIEELRQVMCAYLRECLKAGCELDQRGLTASSAEKADAHRGTTHHRGRHLNDMIARGSSQACASDVEAAVMAIK